MRGAASIRLVAMEEGARTTTVEACKTRRRYRVCPARAVAAIHPDYTGGTYTAICRAIKAAFARHAHPCLLADFEVNQGGATLKTPLSSFLRQLKQAGMRQPCRYAAGSSTTRCAPIICPDKINTAQMARTAARRARDSAAHDIDDHGRACRDLARPGRAICWSRWRLAGRDGGSTSSLPCPCAHGSADCIRKGRQSWPRPSERRLIIALRRAAAGCCHPAITNIKKEWVQRMGRRRPARRDLPRCRLAKDLGGSHDETERISGRRYAARPEFHRQRWMEALIR